MACNEVLFTDRYYDIRQSEHIIRVVSTQNESDAREITQKLYELFESAKRQEQCP